MGDALAGCRGACVVWQALVLSCERSDFLLPACLWILKAAEFACFPSLLAVIHHAPITNGAARVCLPPCAAVPRTRRVECATSLLFWRDCSFASRYWPLFPLVVVIQQHAPSACLGLPVHVQARSGNGHRAAPASSASRQLSVASIVGHRFALLSG
eukprot:5438103-Amphidinium_carterae.1